MNPELSIVIPILNEAGGLQSLVDMLAEQQGCTFEVIFCDGGSEDGSPALLRTLGAQTPFAFRTVNSGPGRGRQMNVGARFAKGDFLLFLHADSLLPDPRALAESLQRMRREHVRRGNHCFAGRFALRFSLTSHKQNFGYFFYEEKARLNLSGCIHGDQGMLLPRAFFEEVGPFDSEQPIFEDEKLAAAIARRGVWILFPAEIVTSARRFEREGLRERQILNALLMNFHHIGWTPFFRQAPEVYRQQAAGHRLDLLPFFLCIDNLLRALPQPEQRRLWQATGRYVRSQAWQLSFAFLTGVRYVLKRPHRLRSWGESFCALWERCTDFPPLNRFTGALVRIWFRHTLKRLQKS
ncbi:transferase 2, rSAM/selenodomain-associated [Geoalkalibacter ferrihydriticus]|uniref:Transferase 2, rSAM/selenodomain-associated n=1 Tax=Geoalkalibacter ferrihydriticus TaxID=392333 RepID=A0A1G9PUJ2_9BACT|nr:TIGR04283 family arsenosugar biosynthesis glycosyltransferase [Geoalkalibacter ferrihydriticus]SDM02424.1 transferase 2, rSAM/selenodomain-associated [Geoalkalibacter ferrihydriticus]